MFKNTNTYVLVYIVIVLVVAILVPNHFIPNIIVTFLLLGFLIYFIHKDNTNKQISTNQITELKKHIANIKDLSYVKNNDNIPIRNNMEFKYIFLEDALVELLIEVFDFEKRYKDVVYSILFYSEAFMRQILRVYENKVKNEGLAKLYAESIINSLYSLNYNSSKYETKNLYENAFQHANNDFDPNTPSAFDSHHTNNYDLYIL